MAGRVKYKIKKPFIWGGKKCNSCPAQGGMLGLVQMQVKCDSDPLSKAQIIQDSFGWLLSLDLIICSILSFKMYF